MRMNATKLYTQLSRKVMLLNNDVFLCEFIRNDMTLPKLRSLLLCRSCKELCLEPFSSDFCQHLTCEDCLKQKNVRQACKWCRNPEDLSADFQSKILIASYRKLCAILRDFVTGHINNGSPGPSLDIKDKLLQTLDEGCDSPRIEIDDKETTQERKEIVKTEPKSKPAEKLSKGIQAEIFPAIKEESPVCPPCCCTCPKVNGDVINYEKSKILDTKVEIITAESSDTIDEKKHDYSSDYRSDTVSSTVPDTVPVSSVSIPDLTAQNKHGALKDGADISSAENIESHVGIKTEPGLNLEPVNLEDEHKNQITTTREPPVSSCEFYDALSSISLKERQNRSIFEKFGLALSPTKIENEPPRNKSVEKNRRKLKKNKEKKMTYTCEIKQKLQPLKLKVRKVNSYNSNDGYSVQYNITNSNEKNEVSNFTIHKSEDCKINEDYINSDNLTGSDSQETEPRKHKRKAKIANYAVFSDDSDFESDSYLNKRNSKVDTKKDRGEVCSCGSGSHVKYFTNICKRARCPCFSQGKPCATCKCRFCSNPYLSKNQVDEMFTDSDSENEKPQLTYWLKEETDVVDVESM